MITTEEILRLAELNNTVNIEHAELAQEVMCAWYSSRSTKSDWMKHGEQFEIFWMLGVVFYAGMVYGVRELRSRKRNKKGSPGIGARKA